MSETVIIESNRLIAYKQELNALIHSKENTANLNLPNNKWSTRLESGVSVEVGDTIQVEAAMVNTRGSPEETIEFSGKAALVSATDRQDNKVRIKFQSYITNRRQFNCNLPLYKSKIQLLNPQSGDYGCLTFLTFVNFQSNYPYRGIEGMYPNTANPVKWTIVTGASENPTAPAGVFSDPPIPLEQTSTERLYQGKAEFDGYDDTMTNGDTTPWDYTYNTVDLEVETGFNTPSKIGETLTAQLHQRQGVPLQWTEENVQATSVQLTSDGKFLVTKNACVTDNCYRTVPTSTGDIFIQRSKNQWNAAIYGEKASQDDPDASNTEGEFYLEEQGRSVFYNNLLCGNPEEYSNVWGWLMGRKNSISGNPTGGIGSLPIGGYESKGFYTGLAPYTDNSGGIGRYGLQCVLLDRLNYKTIAGDYTYSLTASTTATNTNMSYLWINEINQLITTNIIYNQPNVSNLARNWSANEIPMSSFNPLKTNSNLKWFQNLYFGRANDETSSGTRDTKINLTMPFEMLIPSQTDPTRNQHESYKLIAGQRTLVRRYGEAAWNSRNELRFYSRYDPSFNQTNDGHMTFSFPIDSLFKLTNSKGQYYPQTHSSALNIAIIPVFYTEQYMTDNNAESLRDIPFCAFICLDQIIPEFNVNFIQLPCPLEGEFFGRSPACYDNKLAKIVSTQKTTVVQATGSTPVTPFGTYPEGNNATNTSTYQYMPYIMIGADNPTIEFDDTYGRFTVSDFHTAARTGNGVFQNVQADNNDQAAQTIMLVNSRESAICGIDRSTGDEMEYVRVIQDNSTNSVISAQSGIAIDSIYLFDKLDRVDLVNKLDPSKPLLYQNTLFDKLGFLVEQLIPYVGQRQSQFNRGTYNKFLGTDSDMDYKYNTMVKPFTTNAYISGADQLSMVQNSSRYQMNNIGACFPDMPVFINAVSDSLVATNLPQKLDYSYLIINSNIVQNPQFFGGASGQQQIPAVAYVSRNYSTGDFFFGQPTSWAYTVDKPYIITNFETNITLPNGLPAPIENNSSIIYRITRAKALPPPLSAFEPPPKKK
tara:strand:+ start:2108 stop:5236 length:3129 start_codon:yes stop_codon:yes gene_type:complete